MIYLEPYAGLGNRMMAIESAYNLARRYNTELTVYWYKEKVLNQTFHELFQDTSIVKVYDISPQNRCQTPYDKIPNVSKLTEVTIRPKPVAT